MATEVYSKEEILLQDDTMVVLKPMPIGRLKKFMKDWAGWWEDALDESKEDFEFMDVWVLGTGLILSSQLKDQVPTEHYTKAGKMSAAYKEYLYDTVDLETAMHVVQKVTDVVTGKSDPKDEIQTMTAVVEG